MNHELRNGLIKLLESLPNGVTNGSFTWHDEVFNYSVSVNRINGQWQVYANEYLVPLPTEVVELPNEIPF